MLYEFMTNRLLELSGKTSQHQDSEDHQECSMATTLFHLGSQKQYQVMIVPRGMRKWLMVADFHSIIIEDIQKNVWTTASNRERCSFNMGINYRTPWCRVLQGPKVSI